MAASIAAVVAVGTGVLLGRWWQPLLAYAALATAGIAVDGDGRSSNDIGWFAVCLLAGWTALVGGRRDGLIYLGQPSSICSRSSGCGSGPTRAGPPGWRAAR